MALRGLGRGLFGLYADVFSCIMVMGPDMLQALLDMAHAPIMLSFCLQISKS